METMVAVVVEEKPQQESTMTIAEKKKLKELKKKS